MRAVIVDDYPMVCGVRPGAVRTLTPGSQWFAIPNGSTQLE
jgi:hypothetical protein